MKRLFPPGIAILVAMLLQVAVAPYIAPSGVTPNFLMLVVITIALTTGPNEGAMSGFAAGLAFDMIGTGPVGAMALVLTVTGYLAGLMHDQMFAEGWLLPLTVLGIASLLGESAYGMVISLLGGEFSFWSALFTHVLPAAVYDTVLALLFYPALAKSLHRGGTMRTFRRLS